MIEYNSKKNTVFDFLTFEYRCFDPMDYEDMDLSDKEIGDLEKGLEMERQGWGFLEYQNRIVFGSKKRKPEDRNYFIVTPDKKIIPTDSFKNVKLAVGDPESILIKKAADYFGICKSLLGETAFERAGSF